MIMRKELYLICILVICLLSCQGKKSESKIVENDSITCNVLQVNLSDNPNQIKEKLTNQGYHWEESAGNISHIKVKETFSFSGYYFDYLTFTIFDAKIYMLHMGKECDSLVTAQNLYSEIYTKIETKYSKFKTENKNDAYLNYVDYDDGKTILSVGIDYHEQEDNKWFFDDEDKHNAREYWSVIITYSPKEEKSNKETNDF